MEKKFRVVYSIQLMCEVIVYVLGHFQWKEMEN